MYNSVGTECTLVFASSTNNDFSCQLVPKVQVDNCTESLLHVAARKRRLGRLAGRATMPILG